MSTTTQPMQTVPIGDHELAHRTSGDGEPVVLVHGGWAADMLAPVERADALAGYRRVLYHRHGHGQSPRPRPVRPMTLSDHAHDLMGLLDRLDVESAHLVGHSLGALIALTAAADRPDRVASLSLLEPPAPFSHPAAADWLADVAPVADRYAAGDVEEAVTAFYDATLATAWRERMDRAAPTAFVDSVDGAPMAIESDLPGMEWTEGLTADQVAAVRCPVLLVVGESTRPVFQAAREVIQGWFPWCEYTGVAGADHLLPVLEPDLVATTIDRFLRGVARQEAR
ncbi:alpha/beta hydrolase [Nocardioides panacisoli]|uniref:alpha/beta fold hydrolase n=1 Tax=Nocardioides panacisoli TaxID=627624 RepID=UPI001C62C1F9|nr:alpha/beta hydrolase [Nocardioides panacisoli]QYJ05285.1 alpha/beta hydrolase [Nocardioides panacisoli]